VQLPKDTPRYGGWYAMTPRAIKLHLEYDGELRRGLLVDASKKNTAEHLAEAQRNTCTEELARALWWKQNGPLLVLGAGGVAAALGLGGGLLLNNLLHR